MIDTSKWKEFRIGELFDVINNPQLDKDNFVFGEKSEYPYFTRTENNNGILGYVDYLDEKHKIQGNSLAVGMISMRFHYMNHDFYAGQFTKTLIPKFDEFNEKLALYFITVLNKHSPRYQSELVRHFVDLVNNTVVLLPTTLSGELDWDFIEQYIAELEEDRVAELEAYLVSTGLDDYELTEEDKEVLDASPEWGEFRIGDLFDISHGKRLTKADRIPGKLPLLTAGESNQGVAEFIGNEWPSYENPITVDMFGNCFYHSGLYTGDDNIYFFTNKDISEKAKLFISATLSKTLKGKYTYGKQFRQNDANTLIAKLPVLSDRTPDFEYMEKYIRAIEKLTIKGVVEWKDKEIEKTKEIAV